MEELKDKIPTIIAIFIAVTVCVVGYYILCVQEVVFYTKIDNTKIERVTASDNMKYEYTLDCYNESGKKKELTFKTSRELREDAYLMLEVLNLTGVHSWKEVQYNELPSKVQEKY